MGTPQNTPPASHPEPSEPDVDESGRESFPASDPPQWSPSRSQPDTGEQKRKEPDNSRKPRV
jgi:hypothetical protein